MGIGLGLDCNRLTKPPTFFDFKYGRLQRKGAGAYMSTIKIFSVLSLLVLTLENVPTVLALDYSNVDPGLLTAEPVPMTPEESDAYAQARQVPPDLITVAPEEDLVL